MGSRPDLLQSSMVELGKGSKLLVPGWDKLAWCQGCDRIIETIWMKWDFGRYRCLTCCDGTSVPAFPDNYGDDTDPTRWVPHRQDRRRMRARGVMMTSRGVFRRWQDPDTGLWYHDRQPLVGVESWDN